MSTSSRVSKRPDLSYSDITENQQKLIDRLYASNCLAIAGKGFGKCMAAQTAAQELITEGVCTRVLVVAPLKVCQLTWATEWKKWDHLWEPGMAIGTADERDWSIAGNDLEIVVINIDNLPWLMKNFGSHDFDGLIIDEISKFKTVGSECVKALRPRLKDFAWRVGLSATPLAEGGTDLYSQLLMVDAGLTLGTRFESFRQRYFYQADYMGYDWQWQMGGQAIFAADVQPTVYLADDAGYTKSLPELVDEVIEVELPDEAMEVYAEMAKEMLIEVEGEEVEAANKAVLTGKLEQIAQGALYTTDRGPAIDVHGMKIAALLKLLGDMEDDPPVLIMYKYVFELERLKTWFGHNLAVLGDDPVRNEALWNDGKQEQMAVHAASCGHGINLQHGGHILICLGPIWSLDQWDQMLGRIRRRGQPSKFVRRITLVAKDTVDSVILNRLEGKSATENDIMRHIREASK